MSGGFDLMRFQKCSDTLIPSIRKNAKWITFWVIAWFVLFTCLDSLPAIRSEIRWFEVVREMLMTGDWLHPRINGQPYFDKPLVSYWFAAILSKLGDGRVTAMTIRMPSVLFALAGLSCIVSVARKFYSDRTAYLAGWLLLSTSSFIFWGRLGEADMEQAVFIVMAVTVYLCNRETASFPAYLAFWACCAIGAQIRGLPAFIIPPALALIDCIIRKSFRQHLNWKSFLALFLGGICVYLTPDMLAAITSDDRTGGMMPMFRENLARLVHPRNPNADSWQVHFLPHLLIPWTPFFVFAVIDHVRSLVRREPQSQDTQWLFVSIVFIFVLLHAYGAFRSCCSLSIVPWCVLFTAAWFSEPRENWTPLRKITDKLLKLVAMLIPFTANLLIFMTVSLMVHAAISPAGIGRLFRPLLLWSDLKRVMFYLLPFGFIAGIAWLVNWRRTRKKLLRGDAEGAFAPPADPLNRAVPFVTFVMFTVFSVVVPTLGGTDSFDPDRSFFRMVRHDLEKLAEHDPGFPKRMAVFGSIDAAEVAYYLDLPEPVHVYSPEKTDDSGRPAFPNAQGPDEFRAFLAELLEKGGMVISRQECVDRLDGTAEWKDIAETLHDIYWDSCHLTEIQENKLKRLRDAPDWQDDPDLKKKILELEGKRLIVFYHIPFAKPESIAQPAEADGAEGTMQL